MKKLFILTCCLAIIASCASKKTIASMSESDAARAASKFPGATMATLQQGKLSYEENCGKCHGLKSPSEYNEEQWRKHVKRMAPKAKIDKPTEDLVLQYVVTMCGK
jgi:cytochrome c5